MKKCNKEGCNYPVFSHGFCSMHQYLRTDKKKPKAIKKVSDKRKVKNEVYKTARAEFLYNFPMCEVCGNNPATEIHHTYSGKDRDKYFLDETTWIPICRDCHNKIHSNPKWARENGYLK